MPNPTSATDSVALAQAGSDWINDANPHTGDWAIIQVISDATINTITQSAIFLNGTSTLFTFAGVILTAGTIVRGRFSSIRLTSGVIIAVRAV